jgi:hypothetical protein
MVKPSSITQFAFPNDSHGSGPALQLAMPKLAEQPVHFLPNTSSSDKFHAFK